MRKSYRFQFPIGWEFQKWGFAVWLQKPIIEKYICPPMNDRDEPSLSGFLDSFK
jgi:hypothetical protein